MEPITLVSSVMAVLLPYLKRGATDLAQEVGQAACDKAKSLLDRVKERLGNDPTAVEALNKVQAKPEVYRGVIEDKLVEKIEADPSLAKELQSRLDDMGVEVIQKIKAAENVIGVEAGKMASGKVRVTQDIDGGKNIVGVKISQLGG